MKKMFLLLGAYLMLCSHITDKTVLTGKMEGLDKTDSLLVFAPSGKDTLATHDGRFTYEFKGTGPELVRIYNYPKSLGNGKMQALRMQPVSVLMFPGQDLQFDGDFDNYKITGSDFYDEYNKVKVSLHDADSVRLSINAAYMDLMRAEAPREQILAKFEELKKADAKLHEGMEKYVAAHLNSEVSLYLVYMYRPRFGEKYMDKFTDTLKNGRLKGFYAELAAHYEKMAARRAAAKVINEGNMAPDFTLKDINGNDFTLSSLRGKYVVLDFWGSWCGWCIKGFPEMKKMYAKYSDKLEIVGIDCRDTEDKWKAAVAEHGITWTNVINSTDKKHDLTTIYNVPGFPTKLILSPEGRIIKIVVGEKPEFYETIDRLMKK